MAAEVKKAGGLLPIGYTPEHVIVSEAARYWAPYFAKYNDTFGKLTVYIEGMDLFRKILEGIPSETREAVYDIGSGTGLPLRTLCKSRRSIGKLSVSDYVPEAIDILTPEVVSLGKRYKFGIDVQRFDMVDNFPYVSGASHITTCLLGMCYLPGESWRHVMSEMVRITEPGGWIVISFLSEGFDFKKEATREKLKNEDPDVLKLFFRHSLPHLIKIGEMAKSGRITYPRTDEVEAWAYALGLRSVKTESFWCPTMVYLWGQKPL